MPYECLQIFRRILTVDGHGVVAQAYDGREAVELYSQMDVTADIVLMDRCRHCSFLLMILAANQFSRLRAQAWSESGFFLPLRPLIEVTQNLKGLGRNHWDA